MKAMVTGGAGFIGSTLVEALLGRGDEVVVVDDLSRGRREQVNGAAAFEQVDVTSAQFRDLVAATKPEVIFHEAAQIDVRRSIREPLLDTHINVVGTVNVLQAAVDAGTRRVIFASSGGTVYGDDAPLPTPETYHGTPGSLYGAAKLCAETYGRMYQLLHGLEFVALRYANVYGPRQDPHGEAGVVAIFAQRLLRGEVCVINGDGKQSRDYVYVDDVVAANLAAAAGPVGAYNVGTGLETDVNEIQDAIAKACGVTAAPNHGATKAGEQRRSCLANRLAGDALGWSPRVPLGDGIARTVDYFKIPVG